MTFNKVFYVIFWKNIENAQKTIYGVNAVANCSIDNPVCNMLNLLLKYLSCHCPQTIQQFLNRTSLRNVESCCTMCVVTQVWINICVAWKSFFIPPASVDYLRYICFCFGVFLTFETAFFSRVFGSYILNFRYRPWRRTKHLHKTRTELIPCYVCAD